MNGVNIGTFDSTQPPDTQSAGLGDDQIRSTKTTLQQVLDDEHNFPSAGGSAVGYHRLGSARPYFGTQSRVSSSGTDGRLMMTSDTSRLFGVGSGGTVFLGGSQSLSVGTNADTAGGRSHWVEEFGEGITGALGSVAVTFPNSGFSGRPYLSVTPFGPGVNPFVPVVEAASATAFTVVTYSDTATPTVASNASFFWRSIGTRAL